MCALQIIYPDDMLHSSQPDEMFLAEYAHACQSNIPCLLLSSEAAALGDYRFSSGFLANTPVLWRGWMLRADEYESLSRAVEKRGARLLTSCQQYLQCHHLPGWYESCRNLTPETIVTSEDADFAALTYQYRWPAYFVKDYVKSLTTSRALSLAMRKKLVKSSHYLNSFAVKLKVEYACDAWRNLIHPAKGDFLFSMAKFMPQTAIFPPGLSTLPHVLTALFTL